MTDLETAILIKNMARETVRRMTAKNAASLRGNEMRSIEVFYADGSTRKIEIEKGVSEAAIKDMFPIGKPGRSGKGDASEIKSVKIKNTVAKNAMRGAEVTYQTDDGKTGSYRTSINGTDAEIKDYFKPGKKINIGDGGRDRMATIKSVKVLNVARAAAKNVERLYDVFAVNEKTGARTKLNKMPMSHDKAVTFKSKFSDHPGRRLLLEEV